MTRELEGLALRVEEVVAGLSEKEREAVLWLPTPRDANPALWLPGRPFSSTWRKGRVEQFRTLVGLVGLGACDTKISRDERLFRLTKPLGLAVREHLQSLTVQP